MSKDLREPRRRQYGNPTVNCSSEKQTRAGIFVDFNFQSRQNRDYYHKEIS
jgi:hypothetical protein